ncbi:MAG: carbonate dehydratase [Rhodothermales bacterium]
MRILPELFAKNRDWAQRVEEETPGFFAELSRDQAPKYLWIGCADSRVPANQIVDLSPGDMFVHRNIANLVIHTDMNCLSVIQYAVDVLQVKHIIVCGHYGCGGVRAALGETNLGLIDNWLRVIRDVKSRHADELDHLTTHDEVADRLCELNAIEQAANVCRTTILQQAWARGQRLSVHGWLYSLTDGLLQDLGFSVSESDDVEARLEAATARLVASTAK